MARAKLMPFYEQVARLIEEEIRSGHFTVGQKIYSIREICQQFDVGDVTAKKALRLLRQRGLVSTVAGGGIYAADPGERGDGKVRQNTAFFLRMGMHPAPIYVYGQDIIQQELHRRGMAMTYCVADPDEAFDSIIKCIRQSQAACLLVFPRHGSHVDQDPRMKQLHELDLPTLMIESRDDKYSFVTADIERSTAELATYLYETGHRRICLATGFVRKVNGFKTALARWNDSSVQHWILSESGRSDEDVRDLTQRVLQLAPRPTVVICSGDRTAAVMVSFLRQANIRVPEDISVATFDDHPVDRQLSPVPLTVVRHPTRVVAQEVAEWAAMQIEKGSSCRRIRREITGTLIIRDSTMPPSSGS